MRTGRLACLLAFGLLLSVTTSSLPAMAGCSSLVAQPTGCANAIYESAKRNVQAKVAGAGSWAASVPGFAIACGQLPEVGVDLPGFPAIPGLPAPPVLPGTEPAAAYGEALQGHAAAFRDGASGNVFPAAATLIADGFGSTLVVAAFYSDAGDALLLGIVPQELPPISTEFPDPPQPAPPGATLPTAPDVGSDVASLSAWLAATSGSAKEGGAAMVACFQGAPVP